jgi:hypothetical protein
MVVARENDRDGCGNLPAWIAETLLESPSNDVILRRCRDE